MSLTKRPSHGLRTITKTLIPTSGESVSTKSWELRRPQRRKHKILTPNF